MSTRIKILKTIATESCSTLTDKVQQDKVNDQIANVPNIRNKQKEVETIDQMDVHGPCPGDHNAVKKRDNENIGKRKEENNRGGYKMNDIDLTGKVRKYLEVATESMIRKKNKTENNNSQDE